MQLANMDKQFKIYTCFGNWYTRETILYYFPLVIDLLLYDLNNKYISLYHYIYTPFFHWLFFLNV